MAITTLFGINGVGKDTIAENLRKKKSRDYSIKCI